MLNSLIYNIARYGLVTKYGDLVNMKIEKLVQYMSNSYAGAP